MISLGLRLVFHPRALGLRSQRHKENQLTNRLLFCLYVAQEHDLSQPIGVAVGIGNRWRVREVLLFPGHKLAAQM
jgi:hypothetical protein